MLAHKNGARVGAVDSDMARGAVLIARAADVVERGGLGCEGVPGGGVALKAELGDRGPDEHSGIIGAVWLVAGLAVADGEAGMFKDEGAFLVLVAGKAWLVAGGR